MYLQFIRINSSLDQEQLIEKAVERKPEFQAIPGLIQKYYVKTPEPNQYAGVYVWDSLESIQKFRETDLARSIPEAYKATSAPAIEVSEIMFTLRD